MNLSKKTIGFFFVLGSFSLLSFTATAQKAATKPVSKHSSTHSSLLASQGDIKKEINLVDSLMLIYSVKNEAKQQEAVASNIYGDDWNTERVNPYRNSDTKLPDSLIIDCSDFSMPLANTYITSNYGFRGRRMHYGTDLKLQVGDTIQAAFAGKVRVCNYDRGGYGYYVVVRHNNGFETVYGHLSDFLVEEGQDVKVGEPIALGGNTGRSTGPHLHFEVRVKGQPINPIEIFDFKNQVTHMDTYVFNGRKAAENVAVAKAKSEKYTKGKVKYYTVRRGDTLSQIARKNGLSLSQLCKINNISPKKSVRSGQRLRLG